jgi:hypothetical protein
VELFSNWQIGGDLGSRRILLLFIETEKLVKIDPRRFGYQEFAVKMFKKSCGSEYA